MHTYNEERRTVAASNKKNRSEKKTHLFMLHYETEYYYNFIAHDASFGDKGDCFGLNGTIATNDRQDTILVSIFKTTIS